MSSDPLAARRTPKIVAAAAIVAVTAAACAALAAWWPGATVGTGDAYVQGKVVLITPQVGGTVLAIGVDETDAVRAGQVVVRLDASDARLALEQAEAQLAQAVREVRTLFANDLTLQSQAAVREAEATRLQTELAQARDDVGRRASLVADGAIGREEFDHAGARLDAARSALAAAQAAARAAYAQLAANRSLTDRTSVAQHPNVQRAAARVREACLALKRTELPAPVSGQVARRGVQVGQRVQAGAPLMSVVPLETLWVDANFKESQLARLRIGQPATLVADMYGGSVPYHGRVAGLGPGTGSAFALLPAQNATGNWIKVVQRVPVRIALDRGELAAHPLRVGLSMQVEVDTSDTSGRTLSDSKQGEDAEITTVLGDEDHEADTIVQTIIAANLPVAASRPVRHH